MHVNMLINCTQFQNTKFFNFNKIQSQFIKKDVTAFQYKDRTVGHNTCKKAHSLYGTFEMATFLSGRVIYISRVEMFAIKLRHDIQYFSCNLRKVSVLS